MINGPVIFPRHHLALLLVYLVAIMRRRRIGLRRHCCRTMTSKEERGSDQGYVSGKGDVQGYEWTGQLHYDVAVSLLTSVPRVICQCRGNSRCYLSLKTTELDTEGFHLDDRLHDGFHACRYIAFLEMFRGSAPDAWEWIAWDWMSSRVLP